MPTPHDKEASRIVETAAGLTEAPKESMMPDISATIPLFLKQLVPKLAKRLRRLFAERRASRSTDNIQITFVDEILTETLNRLQNPQPGQSFLARILTNTERSIIFSTCHKRETYRNWISKSEVANALKRIAMERIINDEGERAQDRTYLLESYSDVVLELDPSPEDAIENTINVMVGSYKASIPSDFTPIAGLLTHNHESTTRNIRSLKETITTRLLDPITEASHSSEAARILNHVKRTRSIDPAQSRATVRELYCQIKSGNLSYANDSTKRDVYYWTARLCATDTGTVQLAQEARQMLASCAPDTDLSIVDALLADSDGRVDDALIITRDIDKPDHRTVTFSILASTRGEAKALEWYTSSQNSHSADFFTPIGWHNWALAMTNTGNWHQAIEQLAAIPSDYRDDPTLDLVEGTLNAAMLLPAEVRALALETIPLYQGIDQILGHNLAAYHARARTCFTAVRVFAREINHRDIETNMDSWFSG